MKHGEDCPRSGKWYRSKECREFSTDGTAMGALIAHQMGTMDEAEIAGMVAEGNRNVHLKGLHLTGMPEEQSDWDADE